MSVLQYGVWGAGLFLLSAYVSYVVQDDSDTGVAWGFLLSGLTTSALAFLPLIWPVRWTDLWRLTALPQHVGGIIVACLAREFSAYCVSFAFGFLFTSIITLANDRGYVNYTAGIGFNVSSASLYALIRITSRVIVRDVASVGRWLSLLLPFFASSLETLAMFASVENTFYSFRSDSFLFAVYSLLKGSMFLTLPRVEDFLVDNFAHVEH